MSARVRVSVIIPTWNGRELLMHALRSLAAQTFTDFETIVVDNASADGTSHAVRTEFPRVRVLALPENRGFAAAVNAGIRAASGETVVLLNNDTEAEPQWLGALVGALDDHPDAGSAMSKMLDDRDRGVIDSAGIRLGLFASNIGEGEVDSDAFARPMWVFGPCAGAGAYRRAALATTGLFDESFFAYMEDVDLAARLQLAGFRCLYVPAAVVYHRGSATARRVPDLRFRLLMRNSIIVFLRYAPATRLPWTPLVMIWPFVRAVADGQRFSVAVSAVAEALRALPDALRVRRRIARERKISGPAFAALLVSPLTRAGRKAAARPVVPDTPARAHATIAGVSAERSGS
jgi:GT2 family glycosyltransferase